MIYPDIERGTARILGAHLIAAVMANASEEQLKQMPEYQEDEFQSTVQQQ